MEQKNNFFRVTSALMMKPEYVAERHKDGSFTPSDEFNEMIIDSDERFRSAVITFINDKIPENWAVRFTPFIKDIYDVWIYCETNEEYEIIVSIIKDRLRNERFNSFIPDGTVNDMSKRW